MVGDGSGIVIGFLLAAFVLLVATLHGLVEWLSQSSERRATSKRLDAYASLGSADQTGDLELIRLEGEKEGFAHFLLSRIHPLRSLEKALEREGRSQSLTSFLGKTALISFFLTLLGGILFGPGIPAVVGALIGGLLPYVLLKRRASKRLRAFEEDFAQAVDLMARALRSGQPPAAAIRIVAEETSGPVADEFRQLAEEQRYGRSEKESMRRLTERVPLLEVRVFATAWLVSREGGGGKLSEVLENIGQTLRDRFTLRRQIQTYTAQGRMSGYVLAALPILLAAAIYAMNPEYMGILFTDPRGKVMLGGALGLQLVGFLVIRKIVDIDL